MLNVVREGRVLCLTLNRPEKRNALNTELCRALVAAFDEADSDSSIGAVLLAANGPAFCAGMDLGEEPDPRIHERLFTTISRAVKPIVAVVQGAALAGGAGLAANAHIVVAGEDARFGLTEIRIAMWPVLVFRAVSLAIGERRAIELSLSGRIFDAAEAQRIGLVAEINSDPMPRGREIAEQLSKQSALAQAKGLAYAVRIRDLTWDEAGLEGLAVREELMRNPEFQRAIAAYRKAK